MAYFRERVDWTRGLSQPDLSLGTSIFGDAVAGIRWKPMPSLLQAQRGAFMAQAADGLRVGTISGLESYRPGRQAQQALAMTVVYGVIGSARSSLRTVR